MDPDPNATLTEIRELLAQDHRSELARDDVGALLDRVEALDKWLSNGGSLPDAWQHEATDLMAISWNESSETYSVSARRDSADDWSVFEGTEEEIDTLWSLGRDVMTGT